MKKTNHTNIVKYILELEKRYELNKQLEHDIYYWKLIRVPFMNSIVAKTNNIKAIHGTNSKKKLVRFVGETFKKSFYSKPLINDKSYKKLIIENPRKIKIGNKYIDPYTNFYLANAQNYYVLEGTYQFKHFKSTYKPSGSTHMLDLKIQLDKLLKRRRLSNSNIEMLENIENDIEVEFGIKVSLTNLAEKYINNFESGFKIYNDFLKNSYIEEIYLVCSYGKEYIIHAAHVNNIKVIEFQHGVIGPLHLGYHFRGWDKVPYFPNEILMFGEFWSSITMLPAETQKSYYGYPYLNSQIDNYKNYTAPRKNVTVISQGTIGEELSKIMYEVTKKCTNHFFYYKLHPGEFERWKNDYPYLNEISRLENVEIIEDEYPLYEILSKSNICIGVYSTAIFEAIAFGNTPLIVNLPGAEYTKELNELYSLSYFTNYKEIVEHLEMKEFNKNDYSKIEFLWARNGKEFN